MPKFLKTWKTKVVGTFCSHIGTVFQAGAASYFACRSAPYENQGLCISRETYSGDDAGAPRNWGGWSVNSLATSVMALPKLECM